MRRFCSFMVVFMVCAVVKAVEPLKINLPEFKMSFQTTTEHIHWLYGAGDFLINGEPLDCGAMKVTHKIVVENGKFFVDKGTDDELSFNISSCTNTQGKVFKDRGTVDVFLLSCCEISDGTPSTFVSTISIQKVKDGKRVKTIVYIPIYGEYGVLSQCIVLTD